MVTPPPQCLVSISCTISPVSSPYLPQCLTDLLSTLFSLNDIKVFRIQFQLVIDFLPSFSINCPKACKESRCIHFIPALRVEENGQRADQDAHKVHFSSTLREKKPLIKSPECMAVINIYYEIQFFLTTFSSCVA